MRTYSYDPSNIAVAGKDRMRFELGDTMTEGGADTCALCDEEYAAVLAQYPEAAHWNRAKLSLVESILRRFSYEVDTKVGPLSLSLGSRVEIWKTLRDELKQQLRAALVPRNRSGVECGLPCFTVGMHDNVESGGKKRGCR